MSAMNQTTGTTRIFMVLHGDVYEQLVLHGKMKISKRFRKRVSDIILNEGLKNELRGSIVGTLVSSRMKWKGTGP